MAQRSSGLPVHHRDQGLTRPTLQRREHNDSQPLFAILPTEIILRIILILTSPPVDIYEEDKDYQPTPCLFLSHSCHQLREIALSSPNAWTLIPLKCHIDWTRECLRRSRPVPFSLVTDLQDNWSNTRRQRERAKMLALRELHRIRVLSLPRQDESICHSLTRRAPELEFLAIDFMSMDGPPVDLPRNFLGAADVPLPKLKAVELESVRIAPDAHLLRATSLTNLTVVISRLWENTDAMIQALSCLVNLELLHLEHTTVTQTLALSTNNPPGCVNLAQLQYLILGNDFYQNLIVFHYIQLPQSLHALCLRNNETPRYALYGSMLQGFETLVLPSLSQHMDGLVEAGHSALKLQLDANFMYIDVAASWPLRSRDEVDLEQFAQPDPASDNPSLSIHVPHNGLGERILTADGCQTLDALVKGRAFYASTRILSVDGSAKVLADPRAWAAVRDIRSIEVLELNRTSAPALAFALSTRRNQMPTFPKLRIVRFTDVIFDDTEPIDPHDGEDPSLFDLSVEEEYTGDPRPPRTTLFDKLLGALHPWLWSKRGSVIERVVIRKSTITDAMIGRLRARLGEDGVDWDGVYDGARDMDEGSDGYGMGSVML